MKGKAIGATAIGSLMVMGAVDASTLNEKPIERIEQVAEYTIEAKQIENRVETTFPWKDQQGLKVSYDMGEPSLPERISDKRKQEVVTETVDFGDGGFKVDVILNEKPETNRFCYQIEGAENYDFFYQPPLTEEEIKDGSSRPPEIEGSYAVYHKALKNHREGGINYATGKVMHIPRPQVWEVNNEEKTKQWAELSYSEGGLCVTASQEFLDNATYPVRIDPTFGYTSMGATKSVSNTNSLVSRRASEAVNVSGTLTSISVALAKEDTGTPSSELYYFYVNDVDSAGANSHGQLAKVSDTFALTTTAAWYTINTASESLDGGGYIANAHPSDFSVSSTEQEVYMRDAVASYNRFAEDFGVAANAQESPWGTTPAGSTILYSMYATYTASGGAPVENAHFYIRNGELRVKDGELRIKR